MYVKYPGNMPTEKTERNQEIWDLHQFAGITQEDIAKKYGITKQRVSQILKAMRGSEFQPLDNI